VSEWDIYFAGTYSQKAHSFVVGGKDLIEIVMYLYAIHNNQCYSVMQMVHYS